jgi:phosphate transport system substrate-binding protein
MVCPLDFPMVRAGRGIAMLSGALGLAALAFSSIAQAEPIRGAGSTFAAPIINKWSRDYEAVRTDGGEFTSPDWRVDYELVGSLAGVMRLVQPDIDFAATDAPLPHADLAKRGWSQFPVIMGGIVVVANIDGVAPGELRLSGELIADIYLGKITAWNDPVIKSLNPDLQLPNATIEVLHRLDGSGSTFAFSSFLSKSSPEWQKKHGADTLISWTVGRSARGTSGLTTLATGTKNSIAYVEYGQVVRAKLPYASLRNQTGAFVKPELAAFQAGLAAVGWDPAQDFYADTTNLPGADAYPIATVTYVVIPKDRGRVRINRVLDLFRLGFKDSASATSLGYIPVSPALAGQIEAYWAKGFNSANH